MSEVVFFLLDYEALHKADEYGYWSCAWHFLQNKKILRYKVMDVVFVTCELDEFVLRRLFYQAVSEVEVTPVVSEGLPGAVTTANPTQVVWRAVAWIVNERRWQCRVPPQEELCRMPYVLCFGRYHVVSHDASVNPPLTLQTGQRVVNAPPRTRQPVRKEMSFALGRRFPTLGRVVYSCCFTAQKVHEMTPQPSTCGGGRGRSLRAGQSYPALGGSHCKRNWLQLKVTRL